MRENATAFRDPWANREFLKLAEDFDRLAEFTESRWPTDAADTDDKETSH